MKEWNHLFFVYYIVWYSLTNNYNNSIYENYEFIEMDKTFQEIRQIIKLIIKLEILTDFEIQKKWK